MLEYERQGSQDDSKRCTKIKVMKNERTCAERSDFQLDFLGHACNGEFITYLDNSVAFIGSRFGDSQLIRVRVTWSSTFSSGRSAGFSFSLTLKMEVTSN
jgi:hypothetical protein